MSIPRRLALVLILVFALVPLVGRHRFASAQELKLGNVTFPNSGSPQAQDAFLRGLAALHSFWYVGSSRGISRSISSRSRFRDGLLG